MRCSRNIISKLTHALITKPGASGLVDLSITLANHIFYGTTSASIAHHRPAVVTICGSRFPEARYSRGIPAVLNRFIRLRCLYRLDAVQSCSYRRPNERGGITKGGEIMEPGYALLSFPWNGRRRFSYHAVISNYDKGWVKVLNQEWGEADEAEGYATRSDQAQLLHVLPSTSQERRAGRRMGQRD